VVVSDRRDEFFLASKCGCPLEVPADARPPYPHDYRPENGRADAEQSLRRLRTDYLDLVQVHMSPSKATLEANHTVETLKDLQAEGRIRFIGMSGILPDLPDHIAMGVFDVFQIPYPAVQRDHEDLITEAADAGASASRSPKPAKPRPRCREAHHQEQVTLWRGSSATGDDPPPADRDKW
jgi:aryl-alcohol dehydrogenase-like predicted oxidoreductase